MEVLTPVRMEDLDDATFTAPDLTTFTRVDALGLRIVGQCVSPARAVLACRVIAEDRWCRRCGCQGRVRGSVRRRLAHEPFVIGHMSIARIADALAVSWNTANTAVLAEGRRRPGLLRPPPHLQWPHRSHQRTPRHLRGTALSFRNLTHYIARSLLETGGFRTKSTNGLHPRLRRAAYGRQLTPHSAWG